MKIALLFLVTLLFTSCTTTEHSIIEEDMRKPLLVGVTLNYPPLIFEQNNSIEGVEADQQISALMSGKTDIIMSGMSITRARSIRVNFADHYLKSGLVAMMLIENAEKYNSIEDVMHEYSTAGVVAGTTSDVFVRKNFKNVLNIVALQGADDAPAALNRRSIDIFVHDAPSIMWQVSKNEADLTALWEPLNEEKLAWGVRRDNQELSVQVNSILSKWKKDGTLNRILLKWLPAKYLERFK
jgi:polar amino acid transport system substrate-binding protein